MPHRRALRHFLRQLRDLVVADALLAIGEDAEQAVYRIEPVYPSYQLLPPNAPVDRKIIALPNHVNLSKPDIAHPTQMLR
jgi:hypothetical protein